MKKLLALLVLASTALASATLTYPQSIFMDYGTYNDANQYYLGSFDLGKVAPGQTLKLMFSRNTGPGNTESEASIFWETAEGEGISSQINGMELVATHVVPVTARGKYSFNVVLKGSELGTIAPHFITFNVFVTENIYSFKYENSHVMDAGATKTVEMKITSSSAASDTLMFRNVDGMPSGWLDQKDVVIGPGETKTIAMKITPNEEGMYNANVRVTRKSSAVQDSVPLTLRVKPTVSSKLKAFSEGFSIIPVIMQPFYSLLSLLGMAA
ncbi:MAG: hypothetical protein QXO69_00530 [archaeon]